jgi:alpha-ketoglutarate-dependent taurine dioxygenase
MKGWRRVLYHCQIDMETRLPAVVTVSSLQDSLERLDEIAGLFRDQGLLVLKGHKFTPVEQLTIVAHLGDIFNWNICTDAVSTEPSEETAEAFLFYAGHSDNPDRSVASADEYALGWHIEQVFYINSVLAGTWNMVHFDAPPKAGRTYFADSTEVYELLSERDKGFLDKVVVEWDKPIGPKTGFGPFYTRAVDSHPISGRPTLRLETDGGCIITPNLYKFDGEDPTDKQLATYKRLYDWLRFELVENEGLRYVQDWSEGDMVLVDLFRMYHAVTDGFTHNQRIIRGAFLRTKEYNSDLYTSMDLL